MSVNKFMDKLFETLFKSDCVNKNLTIARLLRTDVSAGMLQYVIKHGQPDILTAIKMLEGPMQQDYIFFALYMALTLFMSSLLDFFSPLMASTCGSFTKIMVIIIEGQINRQVYPWEYAVMYTSFAIAYQLIVEKQTRVKKLIRIFIQITIELTAIRYFIVFADSVIISIIKAKAGSALMGAAEKFVSKIKKTGSE
ncbi:Hypothetical_protein [Hexamita inflata]|uniref:Hypothetical_protein n=1 Tax=Hexamita inflata TaxID=28002 RepID=A0AA86TN46_9EUKA|nr:Hypothetical protein HINF_LOCUS10066 [Hexamita inflata]